MNKLINIVLSGLLWRQYKFLIVSLLVLIGLIFVIGKSHDDYIAYASTSKEELNVGLSFVFKWLAWIGVIVVFFIANHLANLRKEKRKAQTPSKSLKSILSFKSKQSKDTTLASVPETSSKKEKDQIQSSAGNDPFDHLREKKKLRSLADILIDKQK